MFYEDNFGYKNSVILWLVNLRKIGRIRCVADFPNLFYTRYTVASS